MVCVRPDSWQDDGLRRDGIYLVDGITTHCGEAALFLVGVIHADWNGGPLPAFATRFRPIVEKKTDISIFTKMLDGELVR